jgi:hypothetical protein
MCIVNALLFCFRLNFAVLVILCPSVTASDRWTGFVNEYSETLLFSEPADNTYQTWIICTEGRSTVRRRQQEISNFSDFAQAGKFKLVSASPSIALFSDILNTRQYAASDSGLQAIKIVEDNYRLKLEGLIGWEALNEYSISFDNANDQFEIVRGSVRLGKGEIEKYPIVRRGNGLFVTIPVFDVPIEFLIATGSNFELTLPSELLNGIFLGNSRLTSEDVVIGSKNRSSAKRQVNYIKIGSTVLRCVDISDCEKRPPRIGLPLLFRLGATIDLSSNQFSIGDRAIETPGHAMMGGVNGRMLEAGIEVESISPEFPGAEFFRVGDIVTTVQQVPVASTSAGEASSEIQKTMIRGGQFEIIRQEKACTVVVPSSGMELDDFRNLWYSDTPLPKKSAADFAAISELKNTPVRAERNLVNASCESCLPNDAIAICLSEPGQSDSGLWLLSLKGQSVNYASNRQLESNNFSKANQWQKFEPGSWPFDTAKLQSRQVDGHGFESAFNVRIAGLISIDLLMNKILVIDPDRQKVSLHESNPFLVEPAIKKSISVSNARVWCQLDLEGEPTWFVIELLSKNDLAITQLVWERMNNKNKLAEESCKYRRYVNPDQTIARGVIPKLDVEGLDICDVQVNLIGGESESNSSNEIGLNFLTRFVSVIDLKTMNLLLYPRTTVSQRHFGKTALLSYGTFTIRGFHFEREAHSIFDGLIHERDTILRINGNTLVGKTSSDVSREIFEVWRNGGKVSVLRADREIELDIKANPTVVNRFLGEFVIPM